METKSIKKHINRLLLDPNNYRFIDNPSYVKVEEKNVSDQTIQLRTAGFIKGKNNENIEDLINSFKTNGVLRQDPIQVKKTLDDYYLVIEGNRRTATLKYLYEILKNHGDVGVLTENDFKSIELIEIEGEDARQELIAMGLNHIGGKKKWSPLNQSRLIQDLMNIYGMSSTEICNSLGISKVMLNKSIRSLALIEAYRNSDFGDQFETSMYSIFEEIVKSTSIKGWLDWDEKENRAKNYVNQEKIFSWISKTEVYSESNEFERFEMPIITKSIEIRELAKFITDSKAVLTMENARSVTRGLIDSEALGGSRIHNAIKNIKSEIEAVLKFSEYITPEDQRNFEKLQNKFNMIVASPGIGMKLNFSSSITPLKQEIKTHFSSASIKKYRRIHDIELPNLKRINIFVGPNNSGKTSLLEGFYLMTRLNDLSSFIENERIRSKSKDFNPITIMNNIPSEINIAGIFNDKKVNIDIKKEKTEANIDRTGYLCSLREETSYGENFYQAYTNIYENSEPQIFYTGAAHLCQAAFTSPYQHNYNIVQQAHTFAIKNKISPIIIDFIKQEIDSDIENIELIDQFGEPRFLVSSSRHNTSIDLTKYGEGLQRIYEISLLLAFCRNGILCIDEIDSGIHYKLLMAFSQYIIKLAQKFNVQIFISTHSKECIDAFAAVNSDDIMAYKLKFTENKSIDFRYIGGKRLNELIEDMNLDIR